MKSMKAGDILKNQRVLITVMACLIAAFACFARPILAAEDEVSGSLVADIVSSAQEEIRTFYPEEHQTEEYRLTRKTEENVRAITDTFDGNWSVYFERLDTRDRFVLNDMPMIAASTIKLFVYGTVMDQIEKGKAEKGAYDEELWDMITVSSNEDWYYLMDEVGRDTINKFIRENGYRNSELMRFSQTWQEKENYTDVSDLGKVLEKVTDGKFVSKETSASLLDALKNQYYIHKIPSGLPEDVKTANKTGELEEMEHDAAIVYSPECTYILVIMTTGADPEKVFPQYSFLSHSIYAMLNGDGKQRRECNYDDFFSDDEYYDYYYDYDDYYAYW